MTFLALFDLNMTLHEGGIWVISFFKNCLGTLTFQKKSCLKHITAPLSAKKAGILEIYTFKIITLSRFALLYVCVQGQSLFVNYIRLAYQH